ncbi:MAG: hypothetical protein HZC39_03540 [Chloroflexi bacterium]|nr:hypothetical protein [Chloroflexota bacterium]MBI5702578.1 hypothetical protein [Chloroflexota bacterium]
MILLNFSHPLTPEQREQIEFLTKNPLEQVIALPIHFDHEQPFLLQLREILKAVTFTPQEWQTAPIIVNLPSYNYIAALVLAELHGRMGYFPPILRLKPVEGAIPPRFEVAEVINLQAVRDEARQFRF